MIVLFRNQETACLNQLTNSFPALLAQAQINLSSHGQQILLELVKFRIKSNYFPTLGDNLSTVFGAILLVPLFVMAASNKAVSTLDTHSELRATPELKRIIGGKINLLDGLIHTHILDHYRDHAEEARIAAEAAQRRARQPAINYAAAPATRPVGHVTNRPMLTQYMTNRTNTVASVEERSASYDYYRSLWYLNMSLYFVAAMFIIGGLATTYSEPNTCPAPQF
jgi:hypothetical protein